MNMRVLNYSTFVALMVSTALGYQFLWGVLFLYWTVPNFYSGHAFLVSDVRRDEDPVLFWSVQGAWCVLGLSLIVFDFFPNFLGASW